MKELNREYTFHLSGYYTNGDYYEERFNNIYELRDVLIQIVGATLESIDSSDTPIPNTIEIKTELSKEGN